MHDIKIGTTNRSILIQIQDPASTDGSGKTSLVAANLTVSYSRMETDNDATVTDVTSSLNDLAALTSDHTDWGLKEISSTLAPGLYRLDIADAVFAAGAWEAVVYVMITTSQAAATPWKCKLVTYDPGEGVNVSHVGGTAGSTGVLPSGCITSSVLATGCIDNTHLAADAIGGDELAATAIAKIATGIWQDSTAGDFTTASSIGKALYISNVAPGAAGGHMISGSNAGTTTFGALTVTGATTLTGNVAMAAGLTVAQSSLNSPAILVTGNGTAAGIDVTGGATGDGITVSAGGGSGRALHLGSLTVDGTSVLTGAVSMGSTFTVTGAFSATNASNDIRGVALHATQAAYAPATATSLTAMQTDVTAILADTNELQVDWTNGGRLDLLVDAILDDTGTSGVAIAAATMNSIADATLSRAVSNVQDTADTTSLAAIILAILESSVSGTTWTIRKTGGTTFVTKTITTDAAADPITGVT